MVAFFSGFPLQVSFLLLVMSSEPHRVQDESYGSAGHIEGMILQSLQVIMRERTETRRTVLQRVHFIWEVK